MFFNLREPTYILYMELSRYKIMKVPVPPMQYMYTLMYKKEQGFWQYFKHFKVFKGTVSRELRPLLLYIIRKLFSRPIVASLKIFILLKGQFAMYVILLCLYHVACAEKFVCTGNYFPLKQFYGQLLPAKAPSASCYGTYNPPKIVLTFPVVFINATSR